MRFTTVTGSFDLSFVFCLWGKTSILWFCPDRDVPDRKNSCLCHHLTSSNNSLPPRGIWNVVARMNFDSQSGCTQQAEQSRAGRERLWSSAGPWSNLQQSLRTQGVGHCMLYGGEALHNEQNRKQTACCLLELFIHWGRTTQLWSPRIGLLTAGEKRKKVPSQEPIWHPPFTDCVLK